MNHQIVMPQMGESMVEGKITAIHAKVGDTIKRDQVVIEIATDKIDTEIPSPADGRVQHIHCSVDQVLKVGTPLMTIESAQATTGPMETKQKSIPVVDSTDEGTWDSFAAKEAPGRTFTLESPPANSLPTGRRPRGANRDSTVSVDHHYHSPYIKSQILANKISDSELSNIEGHGQNGRIQKEDLLDFLEQRKSPPPPSLGSPRTLDFSSHERPAWLDNPAATTIVKMDTLRQKMAEHMVKSVHTSPHVAMVVRVDMEAIVRHREKNKGEFERLHGVKLTYLPYIAVATVKSLKAHPWLNSSIVGQEIHLHDRVHLGIAVALDNNQGLLVPVIRNAEDLSFSGLAKGMQAMAQKARSKKIGLNDLSGGTFTITNFGSFGALFGTPIINQPQVAILGVGSVTREPVVVQESMIAIQSRMYLSLSFDHRIVDGALAGAFLKTLVRDLEQWPAAG